MRSPTVVIRSDVLESWLTVSDYSKSRLADELGVSKGRISQLLTSHEEPSAHLIAKLLTLTYLPFDRLFRIVHDRASQSSSHRFRKSITHKTATVMSPRNGGRRRSALRRHSGSSLLMKGAQ